MSGVLPKPFAITLDVGSSLANKTGSWRTARPVYLDRLPPCNNQCPAGENIQSWLNLAEEKKYEAAWRKIMEENPFPAIMGRVCYHTCESACNRAKVDLPVGINSVERFLGDQALKYGWAVLPGKPTGKKVMVLGAGPGGLSAAYHLARLGHAVTVFEASPKAGGMIRYGIPKYRMPREKLNAEIARIQGMGVDIKLSSPVADVAKTMKERRLRRLLPRRGPARRPQDRHPAEGQAAASSMPSRSCVRSSSKSRPRCPAGSSSMAVATPRSTSHARRSAWARSKSRSSFSRRASRCRPTPPRSRRASTRA